MATARLRNRRVRLYESIRTAHLERAHQLTPAAILYRRRRYDFDAELARGLELVEAGPLRAALILARSRITTLEVNEPLMLSSLPSTAVALGALALRRLVGGKRVSVVSYAIGNADPFQQRLRTGWKSVLREAIERRLAAMVWRRVDRMAFGTLAAQETYRGLLPMAEGRPEALIGALPAACPCPPEERGGPYEVIYLGDFSERKGFPLVLAAWPGVRRAFPDARLTIVGKGALTREALAEAETDSTIDVVLDPPRGEIHRQLRRAQVLVLPSQATPTWREQVGLPIVEGLAHGCSIVTTTETGLATWLAAGPHSVIPPDAPSSELAEAIEHQLRLATPKADILATLPAQDGRLAADSWLFETDSHARAN